MYIGVKDCNKSTFFVLNVKQQRVSQNNICKVFFAKHINAEIG